MTEESILLKLERSLNLSLSEISQEKVAALFKELHDYGYFDVNYNLNNVSDYGDNSSFVDEGNFTAAASMDWEIVSTCGNDQNEDFWRIWEDFVFWCEGVLLLIVGTVGCLGNILAICILFAEETSWSSFHHLLIGLSVFDFIFLAFSMPVHAIPIPKMSWLNSLTNSMSFCFIYRYVLYPFCGVAYNVGVFITMAITIERFQAVCYPHRYRDAILSTTPLKRALMYFIPAIIAALILNIPKFLEVQIIEHNGTITCVASELTVDETFVNWIKITYIINPFFSTTLFPILVLFVMNACIYRKIIQTRRKHRRSSMTSNRGQAQQSESKLQAVLIIICVAFVVTHFPRLVLSILAFSERSKATFCASHNLYYVPELPVVCMETVSNLLIHINASLNFLTYSCSFSNLIDAWCHKTLGFCCHCFVNSNTNNSNRSLVVGPKDKGKNHDKQHISRQQSSSVQTTQLSNSYQVSVPKTPPSQDPQLHDALIHHEQGDHEEYKNNDVHIYENYTYSKKFKDKTTSSISLSDLSRLKIEVCIDTTSSTAPTTPLLMVKRELGRQTV